MLLVCVGVVLVSGVRGSHDATALLLTATIAVSIAGYTLVDRVGIQHAGALTYFVLTLALPCLIYPPLVGARAIRRELGVERRASQRSRMSARSRSGCSRSATAAPPSVLAVRSLVGRPRDCRSAGKLLAERVSRGRLAGSVLVFAGIVAARDSDRSRRSRAPGRPTTFR